MLRHLLALAIAAALLSLPAAAADDDDSSNASPVEPIRTPTASDPYTFDSPVVDMRWLKDDKGKPTIVLLQTTQGYVHKSTDGGRNWQPLSDELRAASALMEGGGKGKSKDKGHLVRKM